MDKRVICIMPDNSIVICIVAIGKKGSMPMFDGENEDDYLLRVAKRDVNASLYFVVDANDLPLYRWRNAWSWDGSNIIIDIEKAKNLRLEELKLIRDIKYQEVSKSIDMYEDDGLSADHLRIIRKKMRDLEKNEPLIMSELKDIQEIDLYIPPYLKEDYVI